MKRTITAGLLIVGCFQALSLASGPYMPTRVEPRGKDDLVYRVGQAVYSGEMKLGEGQSCANCHRGGLSLKKGPLREITAQEKLEPQIYKCVTQADRVNGSIDKSQMNSVVRFLSKRYKL